MFKYNVGCALRGFHLLNSYKIFHSLHLFILLLFFYLFYLSLLYIFICRLEVSKCSDEVVIDKRLSATQIIAVTEVEKWNKSALQTTSLHTQVFVFYPDRSVGDYHQPKVKGRKIRWGKHLKLGTNTVLFNHFYQK